MDLETQGEIKRVAERLGSEDLVVVLGSPDAETSEVFARTVTHGDPGYAGPLAAVPLGLPVYHVLEEAIKAQVDPAVYERQVGIMETVLDAAEILRSVQSVRVDGRASL